MADTLASRLKHMKWRFAEARMQKEWNELYSLALAANTAQLGSGSLFGTLDYVTNCNPDVAVRGDVEDSGDTSDATNVHRRGEQGYQTRNTPFAGFIA